MNSPESQHGPETPDKTSDASPPDRRQCAYGRLLLVAAIAATAALGWTFLPKATPAVKGWLARRHVPAMRTATQQRDWRSAMKAMHAASRWAPDDPEVLHASIHLFTQAAGDPNTLIRLIQRLRETGAATPEELALMGRMHLRAGESTKARTLLEDLPPAARRQRQALLLLADLLAFDGNHREADETRREALLLDGNASDDLLQLARFDLDGTDPSRRAAIRQQLWQLARTPEEHALEAIALLANTRDLTSPEATTLLQLVESHPAAESKKDSFRLQALSARLRISPHLRADLLQAEIRRWAGRTPAEITPLAVWLARQGEHDRLLALIPAQTAARYTDLLPAYVTALSEKQKWRELDLLLKSRTIDPAFSSQKLRLWKAEVEANLDHDLARARQSLSRAFEESGRGEQLSDALGAAYLAEKLHLWDLAHRCFQGAVTSHPQTRPTLLPKIYQMAEFQHDATAMLRACEDMLAFKPENITFQLQKLYLQLVIGTELETSRRALMSIEITGPAKRVDQIRLLRALSAHRHQQPSSVSDEIPHISTPGELPPGQRAVYAALLKLSGGDAGQAYRLAERISPLLLLPEEQTFLRRAL